MPALRVKSSRLRHKITKRKIKIDIPRSHHQSNYTGPRNPTKKRGFNELVSAVVHEWSRECARNGESVRALVLDHPPLTTSRCIVDSSRGGGQVVIAEHDARIADNMRRLVRNGEPITVVNCHLENKRATGDTKQAFSRAYERGVVELKNQPKFNLVILDGCSNLPNTMEMVHRLFHGGHLSEESLIITGVVSRKDGTHLQLMDTRRDGRCEPVKGTAQYRRSISQLPMLAEAYYGEQHYRSRSCALEAFSNLSLRDHDMMSYGCFKLVGRPCLSAAEMDQNARHVMRQNTQWNSGQITIEDKDNKQSTIPLGTKLHVSRTRGDRWVDATVVEWWGRAWHRSYTWYCVRYADGVHQWRNLSPQYRAVRRVVRATTRRTWAFVKDRVDEEA